MNSRVQAKMTDRNFMLWLRNYMQFKNSGRTPSECTWLNHGSIVTGKMRRSLFSAPRTLIKDLLGMFPTGTAPESHTVRAAVFDLYHPKYNAQPNEIGSKRLILPPGVHAGTSCPSAQHHRSFFLVCLH